MIRKILFSIAMNALLLATPASWEGIDTALSASKNSGKPIMVMVYQDGCSACKDIDVRMRDNGFIATALQDFELAKIDVDEALGKYRMQIASTPTFLFLTGEREQIVPPLQGSPKDDFEFVDYLNGVIIEADARSRQKERS